MATGGEDVIPVHSGSPARVWLAAIALSLAAACSGPSQDGETGATSATSAKAAKASAGPAPPLDTRSFSNSRLIEQIYNGEFLSLPRDGELRQRERQVFRARLDIFIQSYHTAYARFCKAQVNREPATEIGYFQYEVNEFGTQVSATEETGRTTVRDRFLPAYNSAGSRINGARLLGAFGLDVTRESLATSGDMHRLVEENGCTSATTMQFETNLHRLFAGEGPIQETFPGVAGIPDFARVCARPDILGGKLADGDTCRCVHDAINVSPGRIEYLVTINADERALLNSMMRRAGTLDQVRKCLT